MSKKLMIRLPTSLFMIWKAVFRIFLMQIMTMQKIITEQFWIAHTMLLWKREPISQSAVLGRLM